MEPVEPSSGHRQEPRRPLLMDPAGPRPSGFAPPPAATTAPSSAPPPAATTSAPPATSVLGAPFAPVTTATSSAPPPATSVLGAPFAPATTSMLAATAAAVSSTDDSAGEASFGPVSRVVRVSVRTLSSRIDLVLPDRSTIAETLETVLELAPRSLREQAIAHGGWILRSAAGAAMPGSSTLLDQGIVDGATVFLTGIDPADQPVLDDDPADAIASAVLAHPSTWPTRGSRAAALGAAGLFGAIACLSLVAAGPPWVLVAVILGGIAILGQVAAGLLSRRLGDTGVAMVAGLLSIAAGAAAATVATGGSAAMLRFGAPQLLLGAAAAALLAGGAAVAIGDRWVAFEAIVVGALLTFVAMVCCGIFDLPPAAGAAIVAGLALSLMPLLPAVALGLAKFDVGPLPASMDPADPANAVDPVGAEVETVDARAVAGQTREAVGHLTAIIQGLSWPALVACSVLAFVGDVTGQVLAAVVGVGLILRALLFRTIGQRLPLLVAGTGSIAALLVALTRQFDGVMVLAAVSAPALLGVVVCLQLAGRRRRVSPTWTRAAEVIQVVIAVAIVPLVAGVLGLFGFVRGLGG